MNKEKNIEQCKNTLEKYMIDLKVRNELTESDKNFYEKFCDFYFLNYSPFLIYIEGSY